MVAERLQIAQSLRVRAGGALERAAGPLVQLGPARKQEILVHHLVHERVREPVAVALAAVPDLLDQIGLDEAVERGLGGLSHRSQCAQEQRLVEHHPQHGRLLQQAPGVGGKPVDAGEQQPVQRGRNVHRLAGRRARPAIALANEHALAHQAADDLLDEQRIAAGPRGDEILELGEGVSRPPGRTDRPPAPASRQGRAGRAG